jgi:hypothetical protein
MTVNYRKLVYFCKKHSRELLSFISALIAAWVCFVFSSQPGIVFWATILLTVIALILTLYFLLQEKNFYFVAFDGYEDKEDWFGSGKFEFDKRNRAYLIADTDAGFIFSKCLLWKDYSLNGEFKVLNSCLGVILRATNLSNYIMLQINKGEKGIRPHVRVNGGWMAYEIENTGLSFERGKNIEDGKWYKFKFVVTGDLVEIKIFNSNEKILIDKSWKIVSGKISTPIYKKEDEKRESPTHILDTIVSYDYGAVGFRNGHGERALVRNVLIKSVNSK